VKSWAAAGSKILKLAITLPLMQGLKTFFSWGHTYAATQHFESRTFYAMWMFRDMLHSTESTNISQICYFFITDKMFLRLDEMVSWAGFGSLRLGGRSLETHVLMQCFPSFKPCGTLQKGNIICGTQWRTHSSLI